MQRCRSSAVWSSVTRYSAILSLAHPTHRVQGTYGDAMNNTEVQWIAPAPLWESVTDPGTATIFSQPAILRFASDNFMNEFTAMLQTNPTQLKDFRARRET